MKNMIRAAALGVCLLASPGLTGFVFAQDAMSPMANDAMAGEHATTPMGGDAMGADAMATDAMAADAAVADCQTKAKAETDAAKQAGMLAACDAMGADAMGGDAMSPMANDAMGTPAAH